MIARTLKEIGIRWRGWLVTLAILVSLGGGLLLFRQFILLDRLLEVRRQWSAFREEIRRNPSATKIAIYEQAVADLATFEGRVPSTADFARVIGDLFSMAESNSLSIGGVSYTPGKTSDGFLDYSLSLDATGTYPGVKSFATDILRHRDIVVIDQLSLAKSGKIFDDEVTLRMRIRMMFRQGGGR
ncbi:MAG: hypothetical protein Fur0034_03380 [Desulfuromonadia bacterium]